jgi:hypothetical protein
VAEATAGKASPVARKLRRERVMLLPPKFKDIRV